MQLKQPIIDLDVEWRIISADTLLIGLVLRFSMPGSSLLEASTLPFS